uniref:Uncharacterized protein n=1 Tax=Crocodylus porosus TaxID=8502 RepID=A0A7M4FWC1_CROPO
MSKPLQELGNWPPYAVGLHCCTNPTEQLFILDCVTVESIAKDCSHSPKLGSAIPPYNAQGDPHAATCFQTQPGPPLLRQTGLVSIIPYFRGAAALYLISRNKVGAVGSYQQVLASVKPPVGHNGTYGCRRNTPSLPRQPSLFGIVTHLPIH